MSRCPFAVRLSVLTAFLFLVPALARADDGEEAQLASLDRCVGAENAVMALGTRWEAALAAADWDPHAPGPRAFADRIALPLRQAFLARRSPPSARTLMLELLVALEHPTSEPLYVRMLELRTCPADWLVLASEGLGRLDTERGRAAIDDSFVAMVPAHGVPDDAAWALCAASARHAGGTHRTDVDEAARRLFLFAPQIAVQSCLPLVLRLSDAAALSERVLDGREWPEPISGDDPREARMLGPYAHGAALILLGQLRASGAYERMAQALEDRSFAAQPTRDGAIQGLAALGGARARGKLREVLGDDELRTPRVAHALLRLGDVSSAAALREVALDPEAIVEMRLSAANAYTLLAPGTPRVVHAWERDLGRAPPLGPPFEALDVRMSEMTRRLVVAERCRADATCWSEALSSADPQEVARAFWELSRSPAADDPDVAPLLAGAAARALAETPPNERHDVVAGAVALLARVDPALARPFLPVVRRARIAWEGRTQPMDLPFDIPMALLQEERRLRPPRSD